MSYILIYLLKSTVYLGLFYAFFLVAMRKTAFFRFNRVMLLLGTFVCMLLPCYTITIAEVEGIPLPMQALHDMLVLESPYEPIASVTTELPLQEAKSSASRPILPALLLGIHLFGMCIYLTMVVRSFRDVWKLIASHPKQWQDGYWLVIIPEKIPSFSWGNYIVISEEDYHTYPQVLVHERMHYLCRHSYDILFITIVHALHWFNPMVWLIRTELKQLHEFEADQGVIHQGIDATQYQILLVKKAVGKKLYTMASGFNHTKLKKRITMMIQEKTNGWERLKWLMVVPIVTGAMLLFTETEEKPMNTLEDYKEYFQTEIKKYDFFKVKTSYVHSFNMDNANHAYFKDKDICSAEEVKPAISDLLTAIAESPEDQMHCIGFSYEPATNQALISSYLKEIKEAYQERKLTPLVFINDPSYSYVEIEGMKRYYGIEITFNDPQVAPVRNFTAHELVNAVKQTSHFSGQDKYVRIGFRATPDQRMENVNEVRRLLRDLYKPQQVIFSQTILKQ